jgi:DNA mismatch repair protein MutS
LDVLASLAQIAWERDYVCPEINEGHDLVIREGRYPLWEASANDKPFIPNDVTLCDRGGRMILLTGPNMAGKSTWLRMTALIVLMAQMGSWIPAKRASIGLVDRIFTRIGARDDLARGNSTFMVEMLETADILHNVTDRSLVILDEVGRGTSTWDGMSIAWAVLEHLHHGGGSRPKVLVATHYHELTCRAERLEGLTNCCMEVGESGGGIVFLHRVIPGAADRSYGIEVARLAGLPKEVLLRAHELLKHFESDERTMNVPEVPRAAQRQPALFPVESDGLVEELSSVDPDGMKPLEALELLYILKEKALALRKSGG